MVNQGLQCLDDFLDAYTEAIQQQVQTHSSRAGGNRAEVSGARQVAVPEAVNTPPNEASSPHDHKVSARFAATAALLTTKRRVIRETPTKERCSP